MLYKLLLVFTLLAVLMGTTDAGGTGEDNAATNINNELKSFLTIPYRTDGALDEHGNWTLFADTSSRFNTPGLNCSGLVLAASRLILNKNISISDAKRDRLNDSGQDAPNGEDWDFGWDFIMNISDGHKRRFLLPNNQTGDPDNATAATYRGYDLANVRTRKELVSRFKRGHLYLLSFNSESRRAGYNLIHYHVGLVYVSPMNEAWLYQTTHQSKVANRRDLNSAKGWESFHNSFIINGGEKRLLVLEVDL
ncbi:hypothetical protein RsTz2092_03910 [Deferribacterales bacterium RsTz2092]